MTDSPAEQVEQKLKVEGETSNASNSDKGEDEEAEVDDNEADVESPSESDPTSKLRLQLEEAQEELAALPEGDKSISEKLSRVADLTVKYHGAAETTEEEPFLEALRTATQARDTGVDGYSTSLAIYIQMVCAYSLYDCTKDVSYLHQSVAFGRECIEQTDDANYTNPCQVRSARCAHLAQMFEKLYEVEGLTEHIKNAVSFHGDATDGTHPDCYEDQSGDLILYQRYKRWVTLCIKLMDTRRDPSGLLESLIDQVTNKLPCTLDNDAKVVAHNYWFNRLGLHCRQWANSKDPEHLITLRSRTKQLLEWEANDPFCTCHGNKDNPSMSTDPENPLHVIRRAAGFFDEWFDLDNSECDWSKHIATLDTSIALWEEVSKNINRRTFADLEMDSFPTCIVGERFRRRYWVTNIARDGWRSDSKQWESAGINLLLQIMESESKRPTESFAEVLGYRGVSTAVSCVTGESYSIWNVREYGKSWDLDTQRLKFVDGEGPWTADRWIRERSDDGKFILGGVQKGRDDDVLHFLANQSKPL